MDRIESFWRKIWPILLPLIIAVAGAGLIYVAFKSEKEVEKPRHEHPAVSKHAAPQGGSFIFPKLPSRRF
jgi:hypothetical protein